MDFYVQAALRLVRAGPAALAAAAGLRARRAADRLVAGVVQRVVRQVALVDAPPQVLVAPEGERVVLPQPASLVALDQLGVRARRPLLAANARDPALGAGQRAFERGDLGDRAAVLGTAPWLVRAARVDDLDLHAKALLERAPRLHRLLEQHARVDRQHAHGVAGSLIESQQLVEQHRLLLLKRAQQHGTLAVTRRLAQRVREARSRVEVGARLWCHWAICMGQHLIGPLVSVALIYTAHSPSPRMTSKGTSRFQSMNVFIVSSPKSTGIDRSLTSASSPATPTRSR